MANCKICNKKMGMFEGSPIAFDRNLESAIICGSCSSAITTIRSGDVEGYKKIKPYIDSITDVGLKNFIVGISKDLIEEDAKECEKAEEEQRQQREYKENLPKVKVTTGYNFEGYNIVDYLGVISGECVLGTGFMSEFSASVADLVGVNNNAFSEKLKEAKDDALLRLKMSCLKNNGNAIIGVDFDYIVFSNNMIGVVANGTAVVIEK